MGPLWHSGGQLPCLAVVFDFDMGLFEVLVQLQRLSDGCRGAGLNFFVRPGMPRFQLLAVVVNILSKETPKQLGLLINEDEALLTESVKRRERERGKSGF